MSTQVVRVAGYTMGSLAAIGRECDRAPDINHRNPDIDSERSNLNFSYKDAPNGFVAEYADIRAQLNVQGKPTKKGVAFEGMIITADLPFFEGLGYEEGKPMTPMMRRFFDEAYAFAKAQIGYQGTDKNILSAKVHLDERTPHLHLYYLPVTEVWQSKVYEKDASGHVIRTKSGSPVQQRDADGNIMYVRHNDPSAPKLSRTEFWRARGGQYSYRQMQDKFYAMVGKDFGLERGEVGSDRKHIQTATWKRAQLQRETEQLEKEIKPLRELTASLSSVEDLYKTTNFGRTVKMKAEDFATLREQARSYLANKGAIENLYERENKVDKERNDVWTRERKVEHREALVDSLYLRQLDLNKAYEDVERERDQYRQKAENLEERCAQYAQSLKMSMECLVEVVQAVGMMRQSDPTSNDVPNPYAGDVNLSREQYELIGAVRQRAIECLDKIGESTGDRTALDCRDRAVKWVRVSKKLNRMVEDTLRPQRNSRFRDEYLGPDL